MTLTKEEENKIRSKLYKIGYLGDEIYLDKNFIYIVSGLERSGTSLMMQILNAAGIPMEYTNERPADQHNPNGYFELFGGKIISHLINKDISDNVWNQFKGKFIKITSYGLKFLPLETFPDRSHKYHYKVIYMQRDIDEILESMAKMTNMSVSDRKETKELLIKLDSEIVDEVLDETNNIRYLKVNYNKLLKDPTKELMNVCKFLEIPEGNIKRMIMAIDLNLYREKKN
jgi:hypothetical protein